MKHARLILVAFVAVITVAVLWPHSSAKAGNPTDSGTSFSNSTHHIEAIATEVNQAGLLKADPLPAPLTDSQERKNLTERLKRENDGTHAGYVYLLGPQGQLVAYYTIKGKVSSLNSYLTTTNQISCPDDANNNCYVIDSPDLDGSYGKNPDGIFFFTTAGAMIEWAGNYMYSDQPLSYNTKPILLQNGQ